MTTKYPSLHRDHGVAVRGGISAVLITFIVTGVGFCLAGRLDL